MGAPPFPRNTRLEIRMANKEGVNAYGFDVARDVALLEVRASARRRRLDDAAELRPGRAQRGLGRKLLGSSPG